MNWSPSSKGRLSCPSKAKRSALALAKKCLFPLRRVTRFAILVLRPITGALAISAKTRQTIQEQGRDPHRAILEELRTKAIARYRSESSATLRRPGLWGYCQFENCRVAHSSRITGRH